ncbi:MAG TPA: beta-glucosidase [Acidobacteriota bacterium]|nr:beta-glucosidase [Acidobacteriota bacterium]
MSTFFRSHPFLFLAAILTVLPLLLVVGCSDTGGEPQLGEASIDEVVEAMTLEEKVALVVGAGMDFSEGGPAEEEGGDDSGEDGGQNQGEGAQGSSGEESGSGGEAEESGADTEKQDPPAPPTPPASPPLPGPPMGESLDLVPGAAGATVAIPRLGIPATVLADGPAGLRISPARDGQERRYHATAFPIASLLASSWDTELVTQVGQATGNEVREYGVDILLAPALNIHRHPLGGRNFEYYSEDPLVSGKMTAAMVGGVQSQGVGTALKHFAANNQETNRTTVNVHVTQRALREIYLKGFRIAVQESQPWTIMSSYNKVNGIYTSENPELLQDVLRQDWGFEGYVMTDWFGGSDPVAQMRAGNDLLMPGTPQQRQALLEAVRQGRLQESVLDRNVRRILSVIVKTPRFKGYEYSNAPDLEAHAQVARQAAGQGMVLLKNEGGALPLAQGATVALLGNASYDTVIGGTGSGDVHEAYSVPIAQGLKDAGFGLLDDLATTYQGYIREAKAKRPRPQFWFMPQAPIAEMEVSPQRIRQLAGQADIAVFTLGRSSGEFSDRKEEGDFYLAQSERTVMEEVCRHFQARGKKTVVVLNIGGVIESASWKGCPDAILLAWQPGQEAGHAVADVLSGEVNPSGKLASTFPAEMEDVSSSSNFPGEELETGQPPSPSPVPSPLRGVPAEVTYAEDVYVGYRHSTTFGVSPSYPFGFGLSYTSFDYLNPELTAGAEPESQVVSVEVKNSGDVAGREVVQVYIGAPGEDRPRRVLAGFAKTRLLEPGQSESLLIEVAPLNYASFETSSSSWMLAAGTYSLYLGASSKDIRWDGSFEVAEDMVLKQVRDVLAPQQDIETLRP